MSLNQFEPFKPSLPGKSQTIFVVEGSWKLKWISFLFSTKFIHLWILQKEVEVDRILAGNGDKLIGKPDLWHPSQSTSSLENLYLVSQHRVKLVEHVLAESGSMDGDSTSPPTNVARCHVCDDGRAKAVGWGDILNCMSHVLFTQM